jgi:hypothetical protein
MSIVVTSNYAPESPKATEDKGAKVENTSAPAEGESTQAEQKASEESDTPETEAKEAEDEAEAEGDEPEAKDESETSEKPKKKGGFQRRIDKLNAQKSAAQSEAEYWKAQALKGASDPKDAAKVEKAKDAEPSGKPSPDSFETYAEYTEALTDWKLEQRENARKEADAKARAEQEHQTFLKSHVERVKSFAESVEDFEEAMEELNDVPKSPTLEQVIVSSEYGPQMLYALAQDKAEAMRIAKLGPIAQAKELGKLEAKVSAAAAGAEATKQEPKKQTQAPKPLAPVGSGKGAVAKSITDPNLTQKEYEAIRRKQLAARKAW